MSPAPEAERRIIEVAASFLSDNSHPAILRLVQQTAGRVDATLVASESIHLCAIAIYIAIGEVFQGFDELDGALGQVFQGLDHAFLDWFGEALGANTSEGRAWADAMHRYGQCLSEEDPDWINRTHDPAVHACRFGVAFADALGVTDRAVESAGAEYFHAYQLFAQTHLRREFKIPVPGFHRELATEAWADRERNSVVAALRKVSAIGRVGFFDEEQASFSLVTASGDLSEFDESVFFACYAIRHLANLGGGPMQTSLAQALVDAGEDIKQVTKGTARDVTLVDRAPDGARKMFVATVNGGRGRPALKLKTKGFRLLGEGLNYYSPISVMVVLCALATKYSRNSDMLEVLGDLATACGEAGGLTSDARQSDAAFDMLMSVWPYFDN